MYPVISPGVSCGPLPSSRTLPRGCWLRSGSRLVGPIETTYFSRGATALCAFEAYATDESTFFCSTFLVMKSAGIDAPSMCTSLHSPSRIRWERTRQRRNAWRERVADA